MNFNRYNCLLVLLLLKTTLSLLNGQTPSPIDYFPHKLGDYWEYEHFDPNGMPFGYSSDLVTLDSMTIDSNFVIIFDSISQYYLNTTTFEVFQYGALIYKLDASLGDSWIVSGIFPNINFAIVSDIYNSNLFGVPNTIKIIDFWSTNGIDTLWMYRDYLSSKFGLIRQDVEGGFPGGDKIIQCSILDSVRYGFCILTDLKVNFHNEITDGFYLSQNYPNPFNHSTRIVYNLPRRVFVDLSIYNIRGQNILTLFKGVKPSGKHIADWDGKGRNYIDLPSGIYTIQIKTGAFSKSVKAVLVK